MAEKQHGILIIDDDPIASKLTETLLGSAGFDTHLLKNPADTLSVIRKKRPDAVIVDLMLNNLNGLELVKLIKSDAYVKDTKIIVVTQKSYDYEKKQAFKYGAAGFIKKPYDVETFAGRVKHILSGYESPELEEKMKTEEQDTGENKAMESNSLKSEQVRVTLWGYRSMPVRMPDVSSRIGRQTSCVSIETKDDLIIFDAGSGIVPLGRQILERNGPKNMWLLLTHFHLGHIWGLSNFLPLSRKGYKIKIAGPSQSGKQFKELLTDIFYTSPFWESKVPKAELLMYVMGYDEYDLNKNIRVTPMQANHPSGVLCYKLEVFGKKIIYAPASEIRGDSSAVENYDEKLAAFSENADVFIHDTTYTHDDYLLKTSQGHSSDINVLEFAGLKAKVRNLLMFHFDGDYPDETIEMMIKKAQKTVTEQELNLICHDVCEGFSLVI